MTTNPYSILGRWRRLGFAWVRGFFDAKEQQALTRRRQDEADQRFDF